MEEKTLTPIEQALVHFYALLILAVRLPDGRIAASLASLCELLQIRPHGQVQRILRDATLANQLLQVVVQTPGGPQTIDVLTAWAIALWLTGLNPEMVAPEKRPLIMALRQEAADVLYRYFFKIGFDQASRPAADEAAPLHMTGAEGYLHRPAASPEEWFAAAADAAKGAVDEMIAAAAAWVQAQREREQAWLRAQQERERDWAQEQQNMMCESATGHRSARRGPGSRRQLKDKCRRRPPPLSSSAGK